MGHRPASFCSPFHAFSVALFSALGCSPSPIESASGPDLTIVDEVQLFAQDPSLRVPISLAVDQASGDLLVSDPRSKQVIRVSRAGEVVGRLLGSSTEGWIAEVWTVGAKQGKAYVANMLAGEMMQFDLENSEVLNSVPFEGVMGVTMSQARDLWTGYHFRGATAEDTSGAAAWNLITGERRQVPFPDEFFRFPSLAVHSGLYVAPVGQNLVVAFGGLESILVVSPDYSVDTLVVPAVHRRGVRRKVLAKDPGSYENAVNGTSRVVLLDRLSTGEFILVHYDSRYLASGRTDTVIYLSILNSQLTEACVDGTFAAPSFQMPTLTLSQDTLWIQTSQVESFGPVFTFRALTIAKDACDWQPIRPARSMTLR